MIQCLNKLTEGLDEHRQLNVMPVAFCVSVLIDYIYWEYI